MKITAKEINNSKIKYPYLGISNEGSIVWFTEKETGIALKYPNREECVSVTGAWIESDFRPFQGTLTIEP